jgi:pimeloyl-ACP methyl ester carboxylesterase
VSAPRARVLELGDGRPSIEVLDAGDGPALLFLHGAGGVPAWTGVLPLLAEAFHVYAPLLPGFGRSMGLELLDDQLDVILHQFDVADALGLDRPYVAGESIGGWIAAEMAALRPKEVGRLALIAPLGMWRDSHPVADMFGMMTPEMVPLLFHDTTCPAAQAMQGLNALISDKDDRTAAQVELLIGIARGMRTAAKFLFPLPDTGVERRLDRITAPTLIVWGAQDRFIDPMYGGLFRERIRGARLQIVSPAGHLVALENPRPLAGELTAFAAA